MYDLKTSTDTPNATSSPAWAGGQLQLDLLDGLTPVNSGPRRARANRSRSLAKAPELLMRGTYGPTFSASPVPVGPLSSWENRLRQRLARIGSSECDLTWKASAMSDGVLLSRLVPSTPRTVEIDSGLLLEADCWRTPQAMVIDARSSVVKLTGRHPSDPQAGLPDQVVATAATWPTPCVPNGGRSPKGGMSITGMTPDGIKRQVDLQEACRQVTTGLYPTPSASGFEAADSQKLMERRERCKETTSAGNGFGLTLGQFACLESSMWPTATAIDAHRGSGTVRPHDTGIPLPQRVSLAIGQEPAGSSATTVKRGVLNPAFPCWLMGYPLAHLSCGATAMQLFRNSQRKSLARGSTSTLDIQ